MRMQGSNKRQVQPDENLTYKDYKIQQQKKIRQQNIMMFLSIFVVLLIVFLGVARLLSPDVDITLGDDHSRSNVEDEYRAGVDRRLKALQEEDEMLHSSNGNASEIEEDGVVKIPKQEDKSFKPIEEETPVQTTNKDAVVDMGNPHPISPDVSPNSLRNHAGNEVTVAPVTVPQKTYRVYVGMYSTQSQAEVARGILQDAGLGVTPNIKQAAGGYTLQVGAFSSKASATNLSNRLLLNNYPARVVSD